MKFDLAAMATRAGKHRDVVLRDISVPAMLATHLFRGAYLPVSGLWSAGSAQLLEAYTRTLAEMQSDSPEDLQGEIDRLGAEMQSLILSLTPAVRDWALRVESWQRGKWRG